MAIHRGRRKHRIEDHFRDDAPAGFNQQKHPEIKHDEVWQGNYSAHAIHDLPFRTARIGKVAYDMYGRHAVGLVPVFIKKSERKEVESRR